MKELSPYLKCSRDERKKVKFDPHQSNMPKRCFHCHHSLCCSDKESIPFAVIGSNTVVEAKGKRVRGRLYPWGIVEGTVAPVQFGLCLRYQLTLLSLG